MMSGLYLFYIMIFDLNARGNQCYSNSLDDSRMTAVGHGLIMRFGVR